MSRKCPVDGEQLKETNMHGVLVDRCDVCKGIWLDAHELDALANALHPKDNAPAGFLKSFIDAIIPPKH